MKKLSYTLALWVTAICFFTLNSASTPKKQATLNVTNKTDSDIDELHIHNSGDLIEDYEIIHPGETVELRFDCSGFGKTQKLKVRLVFDDGKSFEYEDVVCDGDNNWAITNDGGHKG